MCKTERSVDKKVIEFLMCDCQSLSKSNNNSKPRKELKETEENRNEQGEEVYNTQNVSNYCLYEFTSCLNVLRIERRDSCT